MHVMVKFQEGDRVKTKKGKVFKERYGTIVMVITSPIYCIGSGLLTKDGTPSYLVNYGGESSYVYSADWLTKVKTRNHGKQITN